jgi:head-tail adaptor
MRVGNLRWRVTFQKKSIVKDSAGQDVHTWIAFTPSIVRSASIKPLKGAELSEARSIQSQVLTSIMVRYDPEVALIGHEHRIIEHESSPNEIYAIHSVIPLRADGYRWLEFWCSTGLQDLR